MESGLSFGYPVPSPELVTLRDLHFTYDGTPIHDEESGDEQKWDYQTSVGCHCEIEVDFENFLQEMGIPYDNYRDVVVGATLVWSASSTKQRGSTEPIPVCGGINKLSLDLAGKDLGGSLTVEPKIILLANSAPLLDSITATEPGSILWEGSPTSLQLEGEGARFPIVPIDFSDRGLEPSNAMWRIFFTGGLSAPVQAAMQIYVNTSNKITLRVLNKPTSQESKMWHRFLQIDVLSSLLQYGADHAEELEHISADDQGSLGESILILYRILLPDESPSNLRDDFSRINAIAQAHVIENEKL